MSDLVRSGAVLGFLVGAGLVRRRARQSDRRSVTVGLTAKGRRVIDVAMEDHVANEARLLGGLEADERAALGDLLGRLAVSLGV